ncbi:MAG: homocysteine S-methyltransferase family protein [Gammaproteobacteria bacterium]
MDRYKKLMQRINNGEHILIDGATGTEVERRGVPQLDNAWNGGGALTHPEIVQQIHEDYIRHGAEIIISNTFANTKQAMHDANLEDQFEFLNRRGVELAIEARDRMQKPDVLVAGGISYWSWTSQHPSLEELYESVSQQADIMAAAGADLLMLEMMIEIDRMLVTLESAQTAGLPVWVGVTCEPNAEGVMCLRNGDSLIDALDSLQNRDVALVSIMHTEVEFVDACLDIMQNHWSGAIGVYAHSGRSHESDGTWTYNDNISPEDYAAASDRWLKHGAQVIGGCCGIGPRYIKEIHQHWA